MATGRPISARTLRWTSNDFGDGRGPLGDRRTFPRRQRSLGGRSAASSQCLVEHRLLASEHLAVYDGRVGQLGSAGQRSWSTEADRSWDNPHRRPSHADRRRRIVREMLRKQFLTDLPHGLERTEYQARIAPIAQPGRVATKPTRQNTTSNISRLSKVQLLLWTPSNPFGGWIDPR